MRFYTQAEIIDFASMILLFHNIIEKILKGELDKTGYIWSESNVLMQWGVLNGDEHFVFPIVFPNQFIKFIVFDGYYLFSNATTTGFDVEYFTHRGDFYFAFGF